MYSYLYYFYGYLYPSTVGVFSGEGGGGRREEGCVMVVGMPV